ncbi:exodeoxyribonuclease V subunit alpha [Sphaerotilaceae bacterium SBD11-9]
MNKQDLSPADALALGFAQHARGWAQRSGAPDAALDVVTHAARETSRATSEGHVCTTLDHVARVAGLGRASIESALASSGIVGSPGSARAMPLVLDPQGRVYLHRYFDHEQRLARRLVQAARTGEEGLSIVSGGPGTGKTTRIVRELGRMLEADPALRIALAAPTGKAAARMSEAIRQRAEHDVPPQVRSLLPSTASTIHRLLRYHPGSGFAHGAGNPLAIDVLVVDEASMLDLALAARLLEAVPAHARIVLLGDKDQLAAVESGAVFAEICAEQGLLPVTWLTHSHRFPEDSAIGRFAAQVRAGDAAQAVDWLRTNGDPQLRWQHASDALAVARQGYEPFLRALERDPRDVKAVAEAFAHFRVLCAVREGPQGVEALNRALTEHARGRVDPSGGEWYIGRPVMVLVNDYAMTLFNGDIGIVLPDAEGRPMVHFPSLQGWRAVPPARVPRHETAYAMTVHKSQGSEFDQVLLLLPDVAARVATRELVYTGVTRAKQSVVLHATEEVVAAAVKAQAERQSGLRDRIRESA